VALRFQDAYVPSVSCLVGSAWLSCGRSNAPHPQPSHRRSVFSETTLSAEVAVCDVHRSVHVRLVLAHPARIVRTLERRLLWAVSHLTARMALFRGVARVHRLDGDNSSTALYRICAWSLANPHPWRRRFMYCRSPSTPVCTSGFPEQERILDRLGVVHDPAGDAVEHVVYLVPQVVTEGLCDTFATAVSGSRLVAVK